MIEVTYIDHMGSDLSVVNAARVSFGKESKWMPRVHTGEQLVLEHNDVKLISYLARHHHKSPFNHCFAKFHVKAPIFVARQLVKHQVGMSWNEVSRRYVDDEPEFWWPSSKPQAIRPIASGIGDVRVARCTWIKRWPACLRATAVGGGA